jgi:uncharacterized repeat protein (TIGR01451 family)
MKNALKSILSFVLFVAAFSTLKAQITWTQQNPKPAAGHYNLIHMTDQQQGVIFSDQDGSKSTITINGGDYWSLQPTGWDRNTKVTDAEFFTNKVGIISAYTDSMLKTYDGGITWAKFGYGFGISDMAFKDTSNGFGSAIYEMAPPVPSYYYKTTNGGKDWTQTALATTKVRKLENRTANEYWGINYDQTSDNNKKLWRTSDFGQTFTPVETGSVKPLFSVHFLNENLGWAGGDSGYVARTTNGGQTWQSDYVFASGPIMKIKFITPEIGWLLSNGGQIFYSTNGGQTWAVHPYMPFVWFLDFDFINQNEGWAAGWNGAIAHTTDGGQNWAIQTKGPLSNINQGAMQGSVAWLVGDAGLVLRSEDKGISWNQINMPIEPMLPESVNFTDIQFIGGTTGYLAYSSGILKTSNGGDTWNQLTNATSGVTDLQFLSKDTGFCVDGGGGFHKTEDGGQTWTTLAAPFSSFPIHKVNMVDINIGFRMMTNFANVNSEASMVLKTTDGGSSWFSIDPPGGWSKLYDISFTDSLNGWLLPQIWFSPPASVLRTTDGGLSWNPVSQVNGFTIKFITPNIGFVAGGGLAKTTDGGLTWESGGDAANSNIRGLVLQDENPVVLYGQGGVIFTPNVWTGPDSYVISGRLVKKENSNCVIDTNEVGLTNKILIAEPGPFYTSTKKDGKYSIRLEPGNYSIREVPLSPVMVNVESQFCPPGNLPRQVSVTSLLDTVENQDFINDVNICPVLVVNQDQWRLRPCRKSNLTVSIQNKGNAISDTEYVHLKFPPHLHFVSASEIYDYNATDSTYRFKIQPLQPEDYIFLEIEDSVSCIPNQLNNQSLCVKAWIPNVPPCLLQSPNWDGADLEVSSRCLPNGQTRFSIRNKGNAMPSVSQYRIFIDSSLVYQAQFQLAPNSTMSVTLPATAPAGFARLVVPQSANHPLSTFASAEANCATGISTNGIFPQPDQSPLVDIECVTVTNAYDPNDKQVFPTGWGTAGNVEPGTEFKFTIRFQNTGTDTAFKVVLVDTLDDDLDIASLQIGNASHPYQFKVSGKGRPVFTWTFDNILLPDSNTNQEASNGFVNFSIRPKAGLALGTRLENFADIYFDYNDPIRTNTTVNTLWRPTLDPGILDTVFVTEVKQKLAVKTLAIHPNPAQDVITIQLPEGNAGLLEITDLQGRILQSSKIISGQVISIKDLKPGVYFLKTEGYKAERLVVKP